MKKSIIPLLFLFLLPFISAITLCPSGLTPNKNYDYVFNFTTNSDCSGVLLSYTGTIKTNDYGYNCSEITIDPIGSKVPGYLCEYRSTQGNPIALRKIHNFSQIIFDSVRMSNVYSNNWANVTGGQINNNLAWNNLTAGAIHLNDLNSTITGDRTFNLGGNDIGFKFTNPVGGMNWTFTGGAMGHLIEFIQSGTNIVMPTHLVHMVADDTDAVTLHLTHNNNLGTALLVDNGIINFSQADNFIIGNLTATQNIDLGSYNLNTTGLGRFGSTYQAVLGDDANTRAGFFTNGVYQTNIATGTTGIDITNLVSGYYAELVSGAGYSGYFESPNNSVYLANGLNAITSNGNISVNGNVSAKYFYGRTATLGSSHLAILGDDINHNSAKFTSMGVGIINDVVIANDFYGIESTAHITDGSTGAGYFGDEVNIVTLSDGTYALNVQGNSTFSGNITTTGDITATHYFGDGSHLTGISGMNYTNLVLTNKSNTFSNGFTQNFGNNNITTTGRAYFGKTLNLTSTSTPSIMTILGAINNGNASKINLWEDVKSGGFIRYNGAGNQLEIGTNNVGVEKNAIVIDRTFNRVSFPLTDRLQIGEILNANLRIYGSTGTTGGARVWVMDDDSVGDGTGTPIGGGLMWNVDDKAYGITSDGTSEYRHLGMPMASNNTEFYGNISIVGLGNFGSTYQAVLGNDGGTKAGSFTDGTNIVYLGDSSYAVNSYGENKFDNGINMVYLTTVDYAINEVGNISYDGNQGVSDTYDDGVDTQITFTNGGATAISTAFDVSLMTDITYLNTNVDNKLKLVPVKFKWNTDGLNQFANSDKKTNYQIGYIAQDVQKFYPDCVIQDTLKQMQTITYSDKTITKQVDTGTPVLNYDKNCLYAYIYAGGL